MRLLEIKRQIEDMEKRYDITYSDYNEKKVKGKVKFVSLLIQFKVDDDKKTLDFHDK